jgi:hypothetical protein
MRLRSFVEMYCNVDLTLLPKCFSSFLYTVRKNWYLAQFNRILGFFIDIKDHFRSLFVVFVFLVRVSLSSSLRLSYKEYHHRYRLN